MTNRSRPPGIIVPVLGYHDVRKAVDWLCDRFGFAERLQIGEGHRSQLLFNGASLVVHELPADAVIQPTTSVMLFVDDVDALFARCVEREVKVLSPPTSYDIGERQCAVEDFAGYKWSFSQTIADVDPKEFGATLKIG